MGLIDVIDVIDLTTSPIHPEYPDIDCVLYFVPYDRPDRPIYH